MPVLKNQRHELFAQGLAKGVTQTQAYIDAGYSENGAAVSASQLLNNPKISKRVSELRERVAEKTLVSLAKITEDLLRLAKKGEQLSDAPGLSVSRAALMDAAKINGLVVDKTDNKHTVTIDDLLTQLTDRDA